jgi:hypothetical protein
MNPITRIAAQLDASRASAKLGAGNARVDTYFLQPKLGE